MAGPAQAAPGDLDETFSADGETTTDFGGRDGAAGLARHADGKLVAAGSTSDSSFRSDFAVARLNPNGGLDESFSTDGKEPTDFATSTEEAGDVVVQPDGRIVVAGRSTAGASVGSEFALARYEVDGDLDGTFSADGRTTDFGDGADEGGALVRQPDGKIVVAGAASVDAGDDFALARYRPTARWTRSSRPTARRGRSSPADAPRPMASRSSPTARS